MYTLAMFSTVQDSNLVTQPLGSSVCVFLSGVWGAGMALVGLDDAGLRAKGRKMRRNASNPDGSVQIQQVHCIRGGARREWQVLPVMSINGRKCAPVTPCTSWLNQILNGGCGRNLPAPHHGAINNFYRECL